MKQKACWKDWTQGSEDLKTTVTEVQEGEAGGGGRGSSLVYLLSKAAVSLQLCPCHPPRV